ncbi:hypothetical protein IQ266_09220 [filamentous cyanobacterium LEGE 11480]|uniref:Uncharacterized protein n=1 Tax=Romeriopsis navalis LEGE 11480 TaxID=2777977 RepID=A0A928VNE7_9CYAN|nr:hypothetical protein [Romeriopsis navalis]MBE9029906.1 hypothetical protein [Romeriopsis navalis LEGE 11480]
MRSLQLCRTLSVLTIFAAMAQPMMASARSSNQIASRNTPICYVQFSGQSMRSLDRLCGVGKKSNMIDLTIDRNGDGVPDQLLAAIRTHRAAMRSARSSEDYQMAQQKLDAKLPYSNQVKQLQAQQRQLQKQLKGATRSQRRQIYRQMDPIQRKIYQDPSYKKIQREISKAYRAMNS